MLNQIVLPPDVTMSSDVSIMRLLKQTKTSKKQVKEKTKQKQKRGKKEKKKGEKA